jgi:hypothetical protein
MRHLVSLGLGLSLAVVACKASEPTTNPTEDFEDGLIGSTPTGGKSEQQRLDERYGKRSDLPPRAKPEEKCEGEGKKRKCTKVDPAPEVSAAHGARAFMAGYRWGMDPKTVLQQVQKEIDDKYRQKMGSDAMAQDRLRREKEAELEELSSHHVTFETSKPHQWRVTVIENLFLDDANEEMVWVGAQADKRYYMFKDGKLWAIHQAYPTRQWPDQPFEQIIEQHFGNDFGVSPTMKEQRDERSGMLQLRYAEWTSQDGDTIRAYDLSEAHGAILLSVFDGTGDQELAARLPSNKLDAALRQGENLEDIMLEEGVCYDDDGNMIHDPERCKAQGKGKAKGKEAAQDEEPAKGKAKAKAKAKSK